MTGWCCKNGKRSTQKYVKNEIYYRKKYGDAWVNKEEPLEQEKPPPPPSPLLLPLLLQLLQMLMMMLMIILVIRKRGRREQGVIMIIIWRTSVKWSNSPISNNSI